MYKNVFLKYLIKQNTNIFTQMLEGIYQVAFVINQKGVYITHSVITDENLLKYQVPKFFIGKTLWDLFPKKIADMYFNFALDTMYKNHTQNLNETYSTTGKIHKELFYNEPLRNNDNKVVGIIGTVIDIRLLKQKRDFISTAKCLQKNQANNELENILNNIVVLLKQLENNPTANNFLLIQQIKKLLKSCCNIIRRC